MYNDGYTAGELFNIRMCKAEFDSEIGFLLAMLGFGIGGWVLCCCIYFPTSLLWLLLPLGLTIVGICLAIEGYNLGIIAYNERINPDDDVPSE